ncbi:MAG: T9SS type A sorting domain-containing protein [Bacteroidetes bacterium]|nr:T9SS type A sorting domain-containing protein [Bacteroidota bacterium]
MKKRLLSFVLLSSTAAFAQLPVLTFNATGTGRIGAVQHYVVPACVTQLDIEAFGAQGGNTNGGAGARVKGRFQVLPGDTIYIVAGQQGTVNSCGGAGASAGGGGGSFVWKSNGPSRTLLLAAGGGGGGNGNWPQPCRDGIAAVVAAAGTQGNGAASALGGSNGNGGFGNGASGTGSGGAGWLSAGQNSIYGTGCTGGLSWPLFTGGTGSVNFGSPGQGDGGFGGGGGAVCGNGGGGGYSGGGGGEGNSCRAGGGGGGSYNGGTNQSNTAAVRTGNGQVIITPFLSSFSVNVQVWPSAVVCAGTAVTLSATNAVSTVWNNSVINNVPFTPSSTNTYQLIATNNVGCADTQIVAVTVNPLPVVSIMASPSASVCTGSTLTLNGLGALNYLWTNNVQNGVGFIPQTSGNYMVTGSDGNGCTDTASIAVTVNPLPVISHTIWPNDTVCIGDTIAFSGLGGNFYLWTNNILNNVPVVAQSSNIYIVSGADLNGCVNTDTAVLVVNSLPIVGFTATADTVCAGDTLVLSGTGAATFVWSGGIFNNVPFFPEAGGEYILTGTDSNGCVAADTAYITVNPLPAVSFTATADTVCAGDTVMLNGNGAAFYSWSNNITDSVPFVPAFTQLYTLTGTDTNGCSAAVQAVVQVNQLPVLSIAAQPSAQLCAGDSLVLTAAGAAVYVWNNNVANGQPFLPLQSNSYVLTATDSNGCVNGDSVYVAVNANPALSLGPNITQVNPPALLSAAAGFSTYVWSTSQTTSSINANTSGSYWVMVTDSNGCTASDTVLVTFTVGLHESGTAYTLSVFPNPAQGLLHVQATGLHTQTLLLEITDARGRVVMSRSFGAVQDTFSQQIDFSPLDSGFYVISLHTDSGKISRTLVKE